MSTDENSPWLGLASFTEETRGFFFGREEEVAELERRVQRKLLTILFGKSGLGKTSILQAGLVPGLRARGYFPVYLRIDYGREAPEPSEQIKQAINRAGAAGQWTQIEVAVPGESIWEFLHHRDDVVKDAAGVTLIPLLIFDQFEELFTLAQSDEFGRARAARFIEELADLVENRAPKALEAKLEADESTAERFDFARSDYRVVIALREDYLAPLESLKKQMPSLAQNRLRLAPMTGSQALEAVLLPGKHLVSQEVAEAIVRFVAGGSELANAEVEPSLLSLICRELNEQRIAQNRTEISLDLLAGSHESILSSFYERALSDQPLAVRELIEDELLTESGYRENLAEERLLHRLKAAGAAPDALAILVNRRLLRIEERLDVRRVELTHDVLTGVVKASRNQRHEREAREATEQLLAEQAAREHAARRALRRARTIATGCTVLAVVAIVAAGLAIVNVQRARHAEADARQTRVISEQARGQAEGLLGFLTDDFVGELETFGRYQTIAELSQREIDYFRALPTALKDPQTVRNGALALVNQSHALAYLGDYPAATQSATAAIGLLDALRRGGDQSEPTTIMLARAYLVLTAIRAGQINPEQMADMSRAIELLRPLATRAGASVQARRSYVEALSDLTASDFVSLRNEDAVRVAREAMRLATELGAGRGVDLPLDVVYATAGSWLVGALVGLRRHDEARHVAADDLALIDRILTQRPQYGAVLWAKVEVEGALASAAQDDLDPVSALRFAQQNEQGSRALVGVEPNNAIYLNLLGQASGSVGDALWAAGRVREAIVPYLEAQVTLRQASTSGSQLNTVTLITWMWETATQQVVVGETAGATATVSGIVAFLNKRPLDTYTQQLLAAGRAYPEAAAAYERGDFDAARRVASGALGLWRTHSSNGPFQEGFIKGSTCRLAWVEWRAEYQLGDFRAAALTARMARPACQFAGNTWLSQDLAAAEADTWLSMALTRQDRGKEAARVIGPVVAMYRTLDKRNRSNQWLPLEMAGALYAQALTDERQRMALLREALQKMDHLAPEIAAMHDTREWRERIQKAEQ